MRARTRLEHLCDDLARRLSEHERERREALSILSHDLRNPLSVVLVTSRVLARSLAGDPRSLRQVEAIGRAAEEINRMLQDLVDAQRIEAGALELATDAYDLAPLVGKVADSAARAAEQKPVRVEARVAENLPPVLVDRDRIVHVLSGLVDSAVRFTPKHGMVIVSAAPRGNEVLVSIADTGPGVSEETRPLLFSRNVPRRAASQGVGITPFVAKGIVEAHGGRIWIESTPGQGTTFHFTLPVA